MYMSTEKFEAIFSLGINFCGRKNRIEVLKTEENVVQDILEDERTLIKFACFEDKFQGQKSMVNSKV